MKSKLKAKLRKVKGDNFFQFGSVLMIVVFLLFTGKTAANYFLAKSDTAEIKSGATLTPTKWPMPTDSTDVSTSDQEVKQVQSTERCSVSPECGGGFRNVGPGQCSSSTCCQIGDKWYWYPDKNKCLQDQLAIQRRAPSPGSNYQASTDNQAILTDCKVGNYTYRVTYSQCFSMLNQYQLNQIQNAWANVYIPTPYPTVALDPYPSSSYSTYPTCPYGGDRFGCYTKP